MMTVVVHSQEKNVGLEEKLKKSEEENASKDQQLLFGQKKIEMLTIQVRKLLGNECSFPTSRLDSFIEVTFGHEHALSTQYLYFKI
jgi:hypothetical protein